MKFRFLSLAAISVLLINSLAFAAVDVVDQGDAKIRNSSRILPILPDSDAIALIDSKRFFDEALPKILSANQPMLTEVTSKIKSMESRTGIDLRKFHKLAVGIALKQVSATEMDY